MTDIATPAALDLSASQQPNDDAVLSEVLVEEVSIDGMCGVY